MFDDVNEITLNGKKVLLYPHQLKVVEKSELYTELVEVKAKVLNSYFKGYYWLIEAEIDNQKVFFNHVIDIEIGVNISLSFQF